MLVVMNLNASLACIKLLNNIFQFFVKYKNFACHIFNINSLQVLASLSQIRSGYTYDQKVEKVATINICTIQMITIINCDWSGLPTINSCGQSDYPLLFVWCTYYPHYSLAFLSPTLVRLMTGEGGLVRGHWMGGLVVKCDGLVRLISWGGLNIG